MGEKTIKQEYDRFLKSTLQKSFLKPKITKTYADKLNRIKEEKVPKNLKPLFKMKLFSSAESKVNQTLKQNKENHIRKWQNSQLQDEENIDGLINKVEEEIKHID
jgi:hypothetical protein